MITRRAIIAGLAAAPFAAVPAFAGCAPVFSEGGVAIRGIDPVSYFRDGRPLDGTDRYRLIWRKAIWRFASSQNMGLFERDPQRFAPHYGGFCAMSLCFGQVSETVPEAWAIHDDQLFLTRSIAARDQWRHDPDANITRANAHWPTALCG